MQVIGFASQIIADYQTVTNIKPSDQSLKKRAEILEKISKGLKSKLPASAGPNRQDVQDLYDVAKKTLAVSLALRAAIDDAYSGRWTTADAVAIQLSAGFGRLYNDLKRFLTEFSRAEEYLQDHVETQLKQQMEAHKPGRLHTDNRFHEQKSKQRLQQLLSSLKYPGMNNRANAVRNSDPDSFHWIFAEGSENAFLHWLASRKTSFLGQ
ncbi:hypothetical protein B0T26DRAFT_679956 [Lasiosphaeria miniovina]|uniref:Uncharacterized protein n=1 Tax=Lasiosphaeria miniovina TaxID=1954250 RepID=A0AA39ZYY8_9PEZI|nr:uncharacterized protein B0T26DRAFT_679956 [Lasiosphaeria miniovina]KAK0706246.1 hypothetical protein B0T26DRAFT_679956 [Lasiosphaeria miniovina]